MAATPKATSGTLQPKRIAELLGLCTDEKGGGNGAGGTLGRRDRPPPSGALAGAAIQGIGQASKGCQTEGARGGQKDECLQGQQSKPDR